jgi:hypothetical protein
MSAPSGLFVPGIPGTRLAFRARYARLADARAHAARISGDVYVALPFYGLLALLLSCAFTVGDWILVYWNISTLGGSAIVYLPAWFPVEAIFAVVAIASIIVTFYQVVWDVYENVDVNP